MKRKSTKTSINEAKRNLRSFDWGPADTEKRVVGVIHRSARELVDKAADSKTLTDSERIIYAELSRYISALVSNLHDLPRFNQLLTELKV